MGRPVGSILELTYRTRVLNQTCLNVLHYAVETPATTTLVQHEQDIFINHLLTEANGQKTRFLQLLAPNCTLVELRAQFIFLSRWRASAVEINEPGTNDDQGPCTAPNVSAVFTKLGEEANRQNIGSFHMPGVGEGAYTGGTLSNPYLTKMNDLAFEMARLITIPGNGGVYHPVLVTRPTLENPIQTSRRWFDYNVQETLRVMRRRTVGLGI